MWTLISLNDFSLQIFSCASKAQNVFWWNISNGSDLNILPPFLSGKMHCPPSGHIDAEYVGMAGEPFLILK